MNVNTRATYTKYFLKSTNTRSNLSLIQQWIAAMDKIFIENVYHVLFNNNNNYQLTIDTCNQIFGVYSLFIIVDSNNHNSKTTLSC